MTLPDKDDYRGWERLEEKAFHTAMKNLGFTESKGLTEDERNQLDVEEARVYKELVDM